MDTDIIEIKQSQVGNSCFFYFNLSACFNYILSNLSAFSKRWKKLFLNIIIYRERAYSMRELHARCKWNKLKLE